MKKYLFILLLLPATSWAQQTPNFTVSGKLPHIGPKELVYLYYSSGTKAVTDSSRTAAGGSFEITGYVPRRTIGLLIVHPPVKPGGQIMATPVKVYLEPGIIRVNSPDSLEHATVTGTASNDTYEPLRAELQRLDNETRAWQPLYNALKTNAEKQEFIQQHAGRSKQISLAETSAKKEFVSTHPNSVVSVEIMRLLLGPIPDYAQLDSAFRILTPEVQNTDEGKQVQEVLRKLKLNAVGNPAQEFSEPDSAGRQIALSSMRGKYVLLDFWASWCIPCRQENPNVAAAFKKYNGKGFTVLGVSLDYPGARAAWLNAIHKDQLNWPNVTLLKGKNDDTAILYGVAAIPQNFLIDPNGIIIGKNLRGPELEAKLAGLFANK